MKYKMTLNSAPFKKICSGRKTIELRLYDEKRRLLKVGDTIEFVNRSDKNSSVITRVTALYIFDSFDALYATLPLEKCGYEKSELSDAKASDMLAYYTEDEQREYGVVGIEIEVLLKRDPELVRTSKYLSRVLRHSPSLAGIELDRHGWADVDKLIEGVNKRFPLTRELLEKIVKEDEKQRYSFSEDGTKIRANQGHSIPVDVELEETEPPEFLWHGTVEKYAKSIEYSGLIAKTRLYVHMSPDFETAVNVGLRRGDRVVVYRINAGKMHEDGYRFYRSVNNVWMTKYVPAYYLEKTDETDK